MRDFASWARRGLRLSPLLLAIAASTAAAADRLPASVRAALQRDLGLSTAQYAQYMKIQDLAAAQEKLLANAQGRNFAGSWIERQSDGNHKLVIATTARSSKRAPAGVEIRQVRYTLAQLEAAKAQLDGMLARGERAPAGVYGWNVNVQGNHVAIDVGRGNKQAGIEFAAASGIDARLVRLVEQAQQPKLHTNLQGGLGYLRNPGDGYLYVCSIGFIVNQNNTWGYATAGHCGNAADDVFVELTPQWTLGAQFGTFQASDFPNPGGTGTDMAWITIDGGNLPMPAVYGWGEGDVLVHGSKEAALGAAICRSGRTTFWECGVVETKNVTVNYGSGETVTGLTRTTACSDSGDSGGSFIDNNGQAQGVLSGGNGDCKGNNPSVRSYFQPLLPLLQFYNLSLLTIP